jgi:Heparinase II/III-like protein
VAGGRPATGSAAQDPATRPAAQNPATRPAAGRPASRPARFADAGITVLRAGGGQLPEIWCRCDGGPHGFLSIAAHAHADALSVEVRYGGVDVLADPGTYCYHGEPEWRSYFRSTIGHNTVEVGGRNSSAEGGPFLWLRHANARETEYTDEGDVATWAAEHDGYASLRPPARHRRLVSLNRACRSIDIVDEISGGHEVRLAFHLGPDVVAELDGKTASLCWPLLGGKHESPAAAAVGWPLGAPAGVAVLELPCQLRWSLHRGETNPILGWYSSGLGRRDPAITLLGQGCPAPGEPLATRLEFPDTSNSAKGVFNWPDVSLWAPAPRGETAPGSHSEAG